MNPDTVADEIRTTSYARAIEQTLEFAGKGMTARDIVESVGIRWNSSREITWDDAVYALAYAWRRHCSSQPKTAFESVAKPERARPAPKRTPPPCIRCGQPFDGASAGTRTCPACKAEERREQAREARQSGYAA